MDIKKVVLLILIISIVSFIMTLFGKLVEIYQISIPSGLIALSAYVAFISLSLFFGICKARIKENNGS